LSYGPKRIRNSDWGNVE